MSRFKTMLVALVAVLAVGAMGASAASAATATGTIEGDAGIASVGPCDFQVDYTGTVSSGNTLSFDGTTFVGQTGSMNPCDTVGSNIVVSDFQAALGGSGPFTATLGGSPNFGDDWSVSADVDTPLGTINCTFDIPSAEIVAEASSAVTGPYDGNGTAESSDCFGIEADIDVTNLNL